MDKNKIFFFSDGKSRGPLLAMAALKAPSNEYDAKEGESQNMLGCLYQR